MFRRLAAAGCALALLTGCANDLRPAPIGFAGTQTGRALQGQAGVVSPEDQAAATRPSLAGKVLAALALERVTGRRPDPAHFAHH